MAANGPFRVEVCGLLNDVTYHMAKCCAEDLHGRDGQRFSPPATLGMLEFEWDLYIEEKKRDLRGETWVFESKAIAFLNGELIGGPHDFLKWAEQEHNYENFRPLPLYETLAEEAYKTHLSSTNHDFVYMDFTIAEKPVGRLLIELIIEIPFLDTLLHKNDQENLWKDLYSKPTDTHIFLSYDPCHPHHRKCDGCMLLLSE